MEGKRGGTERVACGKIPLLDIPFGDGCVHEIFHRNEYGGVYLHRPGVYPAKAGRDIRGTDGAAELTGIAYMFLEGLRIDLYHEFCPDRKVCCTGNGKYVACIPIAHRVNGNVLLEY